METTAADFRRSHTDQNLHACSSGERALAKATDDKRREAGDGFDGSWVAHPDRIPTARAEFDAVLGDRPNQIDRQRPEVSVTASQLIDLSGTQRTVTDAGLRANVSIALRYIESWIHGVGAAAIDNLMEDAATAEISRSQIWQRIRYGIVTEEGTPITHALVGSLLDDELQTRDRSSADRFDDAAEIVRMVALDDEFPTFLTIPAYAQDMVETPAAVAA